MVDIDNCSGTANGNGAGTYDRLVAEQLMEAGDGFGCLMKAA